MIRDEHSADEACAADAGNRALELQALAGLAFAEAVDVLLQRRVAAKFAEYAEASKHLHTAMVKPAFIKFLMKSWSQYDALHERVLDVSGTNYEDCFSKPSRAQMMIGSPVPLYFWDWVAGHFVRKSMLLLVQALEDGLLCAEGQREPVLSASQAREAVPYVIFDEHRWRLHREKSRLEVLGKGGEVEAVFRRAHLTLPLREDGQPWVTPVPSRGDSSGAEAIKAQQIENAMQAMRRGWDLQTTGSQKLAREFSDRHPEYRLPLKTLREMANECRGGPLPRGRPLGRKKQRPF